MQQIEIFPAGNLFPIVKKYLINYSIPPTEYVLPVIPSGNVYMMYTHAETTSLAYKHRTEKVSTCLGVGGQIWQEEIKGICSGHVEFIFVEIHPVALYHLYKSPVHIFTDQFTPMEEQDENEQTEKIWSTTDINMKISLFQRFFEKRLPLDQILKDEIFRLTLWIERQAGCVTVEQMAQHLGMSVRQLQRVFLEKMGIPPKYYAKTLQMRQVINLVMDKGDRLLTDVAYEYGHYDSAHFNKDFKRFLNMNPTQFIQQEAPLLKQIIKTELKQSPIY